ncbi:ankyrin repeat-containing domain protein [Aspergillus carlsbadensis]|nr:ankyrin repeat-containing domain protein [Aspergillus carlsbadensis]
MSNLASLPPELIYDIADRLRKRTYINALCQTSRQLHAKANPYLYRQAVLSHDLDLNDTLNRAIRRPKPNVVRHWIRAGADINRSALSSATHTRTILRIKAECPWEGVDAKLVDAQVVMLREIIEILLAAGADVNRADAAGYGTTALHAAAEMGDKEILELFLGAGADIRRRTVYGETALHLAAGSQRKGGDAVELLLRKGAAGDINSWNSCGDTPLYLAAAATNESAMLVLLANGAEVDARGYLSGTPLHGAVSGRYTPLGCPTPWAYVAPRIMQILLDHGADVDAVDGDGMTALAVILGWDNGYHDMICYQDMIRCLLANRASVDLTDADGQRVRGLSRKQHAYRRAKQVQWAFEWMKKHLGRVSSRGRAKKKLVGVGAES